jgi:hemolysin III
MIFAVIAGSCTPLCLLGMPDGQGAWLLAMIWVVCALGMAAKVLAFDSTHGVARWLYPLAGWLVVLAVPTMSGTVGWWVVAGLVAAGVSYSVGAVVAWQQWPDPAPAVFGYHEVFHSLTLVGMAVTFAMVASVAGAGS